MYDIKDFEEFEVWKYDPEGPILVWNKKDGWHFLESTDSIVEDVKIVGVLK